MISLDMVENLVLQLPLLIREKISIGLRKHLENTLMMRLSIFCQIDYRIQIPFQVSQLFQDQYAHPSTL